MFLQCELVHNGDNVPKKMAKSEILVLVSTCFSPHEKNRLEIMLSDVFLKCKNAESFL